MKWPLLASLLAILVSTSFGQLPRGLVDTQDPSSAPPTPEESLELITVPDGFSISLFAGEPDVAQPIAIEYDDRGRLWVLESFSYIEWKRTGKDRLLIFEDTDNDGQFDKRTVFWDQGNHTSGFQIGFGGVWLCDAPELLFIPDRDRDDIPDGPPEVALDGWTTEAEHNFFNGLKWGPDGWLYGRHGIKKPSKVGRPGTPHDKRIDLSCSIWRYHPVKKDFEVWADGTVNPWGLDWNEEGEGFINTSVIDHFWHLVPGARYDRGSGLGTNPYSYALMEPTSDHRHWSGGQTGRKDFTGNDEAGGGHSHCGMMIYQADVWPEKYRGKAFFSNVLGQRINMDHVERKGAAWTATHGEDFLRSTSPWFRAVDVCQGPRGEMMIAEWTDFGECHDRDGIHRSSGRLYEVWYGDRVEQTNFDVATESTESLIEMMFHENVWWRRHALRNLHERAAVLAEYGLAVDESARQLLLETARGGNIGDAISAIQALHAIVPREEWFSQVYEATFENGAAEERAPVRTHLLTLTFTHSVPTTEQIQWLEEAITRETDSAVLYRIAALLQRIPLELRWKIAEAMTDIPLDEDDRNFSLMRWYGFEPLVAQNPNRAMTIATKSGDSWLSQSITRRAISAGSLSSVIATLNLEEIPDQPLAAILSGLIEELPAQVEMPDGWRELYSRLNTVENPAIQKDVFQLALRFGDRAAEAEMTERVFAESTPSGTRLDYLRMLISARSALIATRIPELTQFPELAEESIRAEAIFPSDASASRLLSLLTASADDSTAAIILETLSGRKDFADALVASLLSGEIEKEIIPAYVSRQVMMVTSQKEAFTQLMEINEEDAAEKAAQIRLWKKRLSDDYLANGNPVDGREVYQRVCAACHQLYGEGGVIGPDLTGSGRADLDYFLINVLFPSEDVSPDYRLVTLSLKSGRTLVGNIVEENEKVITFRQVGQMERIDTSEIATREVSEISLMPPGLLDTLKREDVRDLVLYLRTTKPLP